MKFRAYWRLCKPGIVRMVMLTAGFGWLFAHGGIPALSSVPNLLLGLLGIGLGAAGSAVLNNVLEYQFDAKMHRTQNREIPSGKIDPSHALAFGLVLTLGGVALLLAVNLLTAFLVLLTAFLYVVVYTPLKRMTWLNTSIGAIPGALPIACGWTAATGTMDFGAWIAFAILYAWQHPHFYAIAWMYKEDYARGGFKMLSVTDPSGTKLCLHSLLYAFFLLAVSIVPALLGPANWIYAIGAFVLGMYMLLGTVKFTASRSVEDARGLLKASLIYLPGLLAVLAIDFAVF